MRNSWHGRKRRADRKERRDEREHHGPEAGAVVKKTAGQQKHAPPGAGRSEHGKETHAEDGGPSLREEEACGRKMIVGTMEDNRAFQVVLTYVARCGSTGMTWRRETDRDSISDLSCCTLLPPLRQKPHSQYVLSKYQAEKRKQARQRTGCQRRKKPTVRRR